MTTTAPVLASTIQELVIQHFDAHQQQLVQSQGEENAEKVQARATLMQRELDEKFRSRSNVHHNSLDDDDKDDSNNEEEKEDAIHQVICTLLQCVDHCMAADVSKDSVEIVNGMLHLVACFAAQFHSETTIPALTSRAIQYSSSIMERVRVQACQLLGYCVEYSSQQQEEEDESVEAARKCLIARLTDKSQAVRHAAILASSFFVSMDNDNVLLESLLWNMAHDPSAANRMAALQSVPLVATTLDAIIDRVRDTKVKVRVQALEILGKKANGLLTLQQYAQVIRSSLGTNRCTATSQAATRVICASWMKHVRFDPVALVGLVDPVLHLQECHKLCRVLFQVAQEESPIALEELSCAEIRAFQQGVVASASTILVMTTTTTTTANDDITYLEPRAVLFCKARCDFLTSSTLSSQAQKELAIAKIVPDIPTLCSYLELHISRLVESIQQDDDDEESNEMMQEQDIFVCSQLLQMAQATDLKEEGSRRHFIAAMKNLLVAIETPDDLLEDCIKALLFAHEAETDFLQTISNVISELSTRYASNEKDNDVLQNVSTLRIISILAVTLENTSASMASNSILQGFSFYIVPAITSRHALVREGGVSCLGRLAMLSDEATVLEEFKPLLLNVASNSDEKLEIRAQAIMAICDLSFLFSEMLDQSHDSVSFVHLLVDLLSTSKPAAVVAVAAEIASKLLFAGRTLDERLLAQLIVTYFDQDIASLENDEEDHHDVVDIGSPVRMQQLLSLFFPAYAMRGTKCKSALVSCIEPMLHAVTERLNDKGVKVSDWPMARMVEYVESLLECSSAAASNNHDRTKESSCVDANNEEGETKTTNSQDKEESPNPQEPSYEALVAIQVSQFLLKKNETIKTTLVRQLCKALGSTRIDVETTDSTILLKLKTNMDELAMSVSDSTCLRSIKPLMESLDSLDADDECDDESTETEDESDDESSLAEALEAIAIAECASMETTEKENEPNERVHGKGSSKSSRGRRRLASMN